MGIATSGMATEFGCFGVAARMMSMHGRVID